MAISIVSAGCVTPIGLSLAETASAARARVARLAEIEWRDRRFKPFIVGVVPDDGLPKLATSLFEEAVPYREARMLRLAHAALAETLAALPVGTAPLPLLLGLPEHHTRIPILPKAFLSRLKTQTGAPIDLGNSIAVPRGRAAGLMAFRQGAERIEAGESWLLIGGADSLVDLYMLGTLDLQGRLRGERNSDGLTPAEGAAFLLLAKSDTAARYGLRPLAKLSGSALGSEPGHLHAKEPYRGEGLAQTVSRLFTEASPSDPIRCIYSSFNGERYWAREFGVARLRNAAYFDDTAQMEHPAECFGDLGAAHGPTLAALAAHGLSFGYRRGPCLVYASSDYGDRAAVVLEAK